MSYAELGAQSKTVQIGYSATNSKLSDKQLYPYFARTIPTDKYQSVVLSDLAQYMNLTFIAMVVQYKDTYSSGLANEFYAALTNPNLPSTVHVETINMMAESASEENFQ